jgi:hypothetical protein
VVKTNNIHVFYLLEITAAQTSSLATSPIKHAEKPYYCGITGALILDYFRN